MGGQFKLSENTILFIILVIFSAIAFFYILNFFTEGEFNTGHPPVSTTYDNIYHPAFSIGAYKSGYPQFYPENWVGVTDAVSVSPLMYYTSLSSFMHLNTISPYDTSLIYVIILKIFTLLGFFIILRKIFNLNIALITLAFSAIIPFELFFLFMFGFTLDITAVFFLPAAFFAFLLLVEAKTNTIRYLSAGLIGLLIAGSFQSHIVESFFFTIFLALCCLYLFQTKKINLSYIKSGIVAICIFILGIFWFYPVFRFEMLKIKLGSGLIIHAFKEDPFRSYFFHLPFSALLIILSILGILIFISQRKDMQNKSLKNIIFVIPLFWLAVVFSYKIGFSSNYVYRTGFGFWPIFYLYIAILIVALINILFKQKRFAVTVICCIIIISGSWWMYKTPGHHQGMYNPEMWESITWIRDNTPQNAVVFSLNPYHHGFEMFNEKIAMNGDLFTETNRRNLEALCQGKYPEKFENQHSITPSVHRLGWNKFEQKEISFIVADGTKVYVNESYSNAWPVTRADYIVLQHQGIEYKPCIDFFIEETKKRGFSIVWQNQHYIIMQNDNSVKIIH
ncbi:MAG: hypothetical protein KAT43_02980 [Nanoarchaeota archaeon]|nr:hypothetical protein [Nanoarchaeota archaeon]